MNPNDINALATSVIAFITIIGLMFGFYYNLKTFNIKLNYILVFELLFVIAISFFISGVRGVMKDERN